MNFHLCKVTVGQLHKLGKLYNSQVYTLALRVVAPQLFSQLPGPLVANTYRELYKLPLVVRLLLLTSTGARALCKARDL